MKGTEITPKYDSTLGLIFRLNALWAEVDTPAKEGDYDSWNNVLDRIYANLLYRNELEIKRDEEGNIVSVKLNEDDEKIHKFLSLRISNCKRLYQKYQKSSVKTKKGILKQKIYRSLWYKSLMLKDIWLRKHMMKLKLYMKETEKRPGSAMWGK